jgi:2-polyprenyl-6-methoxyphenol hydroxylase-like FAD-dependent oxidoreductase
MTGVREVCVVGGGLAGLAVAAAADPARVRVTLLERRPEVRPLGAGIILQPNAIHALDALGALEPLAAAGAELSELVQYRDGDRVAIAQREVWPRLALPTLAVHRHALHAALLARAVERADVLLSQAVVDVACEQSGRVAVTTADGCRYSADVVVAADGVDSAVRRAVAPEVTDGELGLWWARWIVDAGSGLPREWATAAVAGAVVGTFPLGGDELQVFATIPAEAMTDDRRAETLDALVRSSALLRRAAEHGMRLVHVGPAREVRPHVWRAGRVAFAGDAAHATSPTLSAGGGLAIEDGLVLGRLLAAPLAPDAVLERYEAARARRLAWIARVGRVQASTARGTPGTRSREEMAAALRGMYEPLDDPCYLERVTGDTGVAAGAVRA